MKLKVKFLKISAGRPVVFLHKHLAEKASIHVDERVLLQKAHEKIIAVVDIATGILKENEIAVSTEIKKFMKLREGEFVNVAPAQKPESLSFITKKMACKILTKKELSGLIKDITDNKLTEAEIAFFISAEYECGMSLKEISDMTKAIVETGKTLNFKGIVADKHSIGGLSERTTPIVVAICAAAGLTVPNTSSRAITSSAGTADVMEVICKVDFSISEIKKIVEKTNACLVWGGALGLAPADDKLIQIEKLISLDPESQLLSSIMAKKLAVNAQYIVIEIPYGHDAKVTKSHAKKLAVKFLKLSKKFHTKMKCYLSDAREPAGNGVGPSLEMIDVLKVFKREDSCYKLEKNSLKIAGILLEMTGKAKKRKGYELASRILDSGEAYEKFKHIVKAQKGSIINIKEAKFKKDIISENNFIIKEINIKKINELARILGCPSDKLAGIYLHKHLNDKVRKGEKILTLYSESKSELEEGIKFYHKNPIC